MCRSVRPLFDVSLADEIDGIRLKCVSLEKERNSLMDMNAHLQKSIAVKDNCILERNREIAELKMKIEKLRCTIYTDNSKVIANLLEENKTLKAALELAKRKP